MGKLSALFLDSDKIVNPVDLDFSDLKKYPELPYIAIENDFEIKKYLQS